MNTKTGFLFILASLLFAACSAPATQPVAATAIPTVKADDTLIAEGRVEPIHYADIAFSRSGVVSEILVNEGQAVKKGDPVIRLGGKLDTNFASAQAELANAQKALDDLSSSRDADFSKAVIDLKDAQEAFTRAENYLHYLQTNQRIPQSTRTQKLVQTPRGYIYEYKYKYFKGPASQDWIIEAKNDLALKKAKLDDAQHTYDRLKDGPDAEQLPVLQERLNAAKAALAAFEVLAPFDGVVTDLKAETGSSINAGEIAVTIADCSSWIIKTTDVTEIDVVKLKEGQPATVTLDAIPDLALKGKVLAIGQNYSENQGDIVYEVTVLLTDMNPAMRWGMTAAVKFE
jgi:HlyD family secretion protein